MQRKGLVQQLGGAGAVFSSGHIFGYARLHDKMVIRQRAK